MIAALQIKNFKCFDDLNLRLGPLTLLTGFNGGGKSTALQPLLLLSQNMRLTQDVENYALNGALVRLGTVGDVLPSETKRSEVQFMLHGEGAVLSWTFTARAGDRFIQMKDRMPISKGLSVNQERALVRQIEQGVARLIYISAVREGAADAYPSPNVGDDVFSTIGADGRFAAYWYDQMVDNQVTQARRHPAESAETFRKQLDAWLGTLFPGAQANVQLLPQVSLLSLQFRMNLTGAWRRPANIGYGLTYAFPILVALLAAQEGQLVVVDSPEAHLHPSAQSQMGRILGHFANAGVQIVVETHSDHLLNGVRLAIKEQTLPSKSLQLHFFGGPSSKGHGVVSPSIDDKGSIYEWPDGFFDQSERDLSLLADWQ